MTPQVARRALGPEGGSHLGEQPPDGLCDSDIVTNGRPMREVRADALSALYRANEPPHIFVRSGMLARILTDEKGRPTIQLMDQYAVRHVMENAATFVKRVKKGTYTVPPPMHIVNDVIAAGRWKFPGLEGITEVPVLRPDGTILLQPGYDRSTGLYYIPARGLRIAGVPERPTANDVRSALELIDEMLTDFPFADTASKANTLALLLTPFLKPVINGKIPLSIIEAPQQGTGKSLLAQAIAIVSTGDAKAMTAAPQNEEEMAKTIFSMLKAGEEMVIFDNVDHRLESAVLAMALTATEFGGRILGKSEEARYPQRAVWIVTGNNIRLGGDIRRRCFLIRLDARTSKPYERTGFKHKDLLGWIRRHRGELVAACLTIARGWWAAGRPQTVGPVLGSFENWSEMCASVLGFAKINGFLCNAERLDSADDDAAQWEFYLKTIRGEFGPEPFKTHELAKRGGIGRPLHDAIPDKIAEKLARPTASFPRIIGQAFGQRQEAQYGPDGLHIVRLRETRDGVLQWAVRKQAETPVN